MNRVSDPSSPRPNWPWPLRACLVACALYARPASAANTPSVAIDDKQRDHVAAVEDTPKKVGWGLTGYPIIMYSPEMKFAAGGGLVVYYVLAYTIGILRWVLVANVLALEVANAQTDSERTMAALVFRTVDVYCGNSFGETVAPLTHGAWTVMLGTAMLKSSITPLPRWMAWAQIVIGPAIAMRPLEYVGAETLAELGDISVGIWTVVLMVIGIHLVRRRTVADSAEHASPTP
jgi:hypothetical protein